MMTEVSVRLADSGTPFVTLCQTLEWSCVDAECRSR